MQDFSKLKQYAPATDRNRDPILQVLQTVLPAAGCILEIASGTGQHAAYFASQLSPRLWQPSDPNPFARDSIRAWSQEVGLENLLPPLDIDAAAVPWSIEARDLDITAIVNINMIHISPWSCCQGLMAAAGRILPIGGILYLYGPYRRNGQHTSPSNAAFDQQLQARNQQWGIRDLEAVVAEAKQNQLTLQQVIPMPANNLSVVFQQE